MYYLFFSSYTNQRLIIEEKRYPDKVAISIEGQNSEHKRIRLLVPLTFTIADISWLVRKQVHFEAHKTLLLFINNGGGHVARSSERIGDLHSLYSSPDGFLYITYRGETLVSTSESYSKIYDTLASLVVFSVYASINRSPPTLITNHL